MLRIQVEQQPVVDFKLRDGAGARSRESKNRIRAVAVFVDEVRRRLGKTRLTVRAKLQARERIRRDRRMPGTDFTPGNFAITIRVDSYREIEITKSDVPLPVDRGDGVGIPHTQYKIAVARLVGAGGHCQDPEHARA